jgi:hypothetical protein
MKKVGIVCDNYKVDRFKQELTAKGFTDFDVTPYKKNETTLIRVNVADDQVNEVAKICKQVELHFKRSN